MGRELGRISGPLLAENLLRNGNNLAFETNLLYLNVVNGWLGVKTSTPVRPLTVNGTTNTDYLIAPNGTTEAGTFNLGFTTYQIKNLLGNIVIAPDPASNPTVTTKQIGTSELRISTGLIQNIVNNHDINLTSATGQQVIFTTNTLDIGGNLHATGDITWDGNITFGNAGDENDTVTFYSEVASHIIPDATSTYDLGRASPDRWRHLYSNNIDVSSLIGVVDISVTNLTVDGPGILRNDVILADTNFKSTISNSLIPKLDNTYKIGTSTGPKRWSTLFLTGLDVDGIIDIRNNRITTLDFTGIDGGSSDLTGSILDGGSSFGAVPDILDGGLSSSPYSVDLELVADGLGNIYVTSTDVRIVQDLTVDGNSVVTDVGITGQLDLTGNWSQTGTAQRTGDTDITGSLTVNGANTVQFQEIKFVSNRVTTTTGTNNLELVADGLGIVKTLLSDVEITNDLDVLLTAYTNVVNVTTSATASDFIIDSIYIVNNTITTNTAIGTNTDLQLLANTTGIVQVTTTDVAITNDLTVDGNSTLANVNVGTVLTPATLSLTGDWNQTGAVDRTGDTDITGFIKINGANIVQFDNIKFDSNRIVATTTDSDLIFTANGTGIVKVLTSDVEIDLDLDVTGDGFFNTVNVDNTVIMDEFTIDDIYINDNKITTNIVSGANTNLILKADDAGQIYVPLTDVVITNDLEVNGLTTITDLSIGTILTSYAIGLTGNWNQTGTINRTGDTDITGSLTVNGANTVQFDDIQIVGNKIATTVGPNLVITADGLLSTVNVNGTDVTISNDLTILGDGSFGALEVTNTIDAVDFTAGNIYITDNVISTTSGNLILGADNTGQVQVDTADVEIANNLDVAGPVTINGSSTVLGVSIVGDAVQVGNIVQTGTVGVDGNFESGTITGTGTTSFLSVPNIKIDGPVISVTAADTNLLLSANGTGGVRFDRYLQITNNTISNIFDANNIELSFGNLLLTEDGDLLLAEDGDNLLADTIIDTDLSIVLTPNGTGNLVINSNKAFAVAVGNNTNRVLRDIGEIRQNSTNQIYEGRLTTGNARFTNIYDADFNTYVTPELTPGANDNTLRFGINGTVKATISSTELYSNTVHVDNVSISDTTIRNLNSATNLEFIPNGTGVVNVNEVYFKNNTITNTTNGALTLVSTGTGYVRFGGNAVMFPVGNSTNRGPVYEIGETRYNTELQYLEVYDGTNWVSAGGTSSYATLEEIQAELDLWSLILG